MSEWRFLHGWSEEELRQRLRGLDALERNFTADESTMTVSHGWNGYVSEAVVTRERPGPPLEDGFFERGWCSIRKFQFSDPEIVMAHYGSATDDDIVMPIKLD